MHSEIIHTLEQLKGMAPTGYAMALHVRFTTPTFLFQTYPKEWIDTYSQRGYVMSDPTVVWAFGNTGAVRWADLAAGDSLGILKEAAERGMRHGFTVATDAGGSQSLGSFTRGTAEFTDDEIAAISTLFARLHDVTAGLRALAPETHAALRQMSITYTHPAG